jgi:putative hydrolase of the HAD superfamily
MFVLELLKKCHVSMLDHIQQLHKTYKIGILSNVGTAWIRDTFLTTQEQSYFDDMVLSFEVGLSKPDAQIYQLACKRLDVKPTETVFIDDLEPFCRAAQDLGM